MVDIQTLAAATHDAFCRRTMLLVIWATDNVSRQWWVVCR